MVDDNGSLDEDRLSRAAVKVFLDHITLKPGDPTYVILRAHLVFEELLWDYIDRNLANPAALRRARLSFHQRLALARALSPPHARLDTYWTAMGNLNKIRNELAHHREAKDIDRRVRLFVDSQMKHVASSPSNTKAELGQPGSSSPEDQLTYVLLYLYGVMCGLLRIGQDWARVG